MAILLKETKQYHVDTEPEAVSLINDTKENSNGIVTYKTTYKNTKKDGEYFIVDITEKYDL